VKERLEAAKQGSTRGLATSMQGPSGIGFGGSRIAKPLRGGGAAEPTNGSAIVPTMSNLQQESSAKRTSWFFNQR
jgi:kinesin family member 5